MATRYPGGQHGLTLPGTMPWLGRGGQHPLAAAAAALAPAASSQPTTMPAPSGRPAQHGRSTGIPLPNFAPSQVSLPVFGAAHAPQAAPRAVAAHQPAASLRPARASQLPASQPQGFHWSQRSQLDNIAVGTQLAEEEEEQGVGDNVAALEVGSAPAAADRYGGAVAPSQPEVSRLPRAAAHTQVMAAMARQLADQFKSKASQLDDQPALGGLTNKLDEISGKQSALEAALDKMKGDLAAHGTALDGIGATCAQLLQAVHTIGGASDGIAERLQQLLAKPPAAVTGDMATQTSPQLAAPAQPGSAAPPSQPPADILQTFTQRRPSSAAPLPPAAPSAAAVLLPPRGLSAAAAAAAAKPTTMPTTTPTTSPGSAAAPAAAAACAYTSARASKRQQQPTAAAAQMAAPAGKGAAKPSSAGKPSSATKRQQPKRTSQPAGKPALQSAAAAKPQSSFSRKRPLESGSQQAEPRQPRPSKQQRPAAEALFDSLFDDEQENSAAAVAPQLQLPAKPAGAAAAAARSSKGTPDLAAKVQARLQKHRARFARRRTASQRQLEDEE